VVEAQALLPRIKNGNHGISLVMSHLTSAEMLHDPANGRQVTAFREIASQFSGVPASLSNSSGIFLGPQFHF
ncbi:alanine racemase, partial [Clostridium butyricum]|nr:alanine racemase [Clostridium butyricum]